MRKFHPVIVGLSVVVLMLGGWGLGLWLTALPRYGEQLRWVYPSLVIMVSLSYSWYCSSFVRDMFVAVTYGFFTGAAAGIALAIANIVESFYAWELLRLLRDPIAGGLGIGLATAGMIYLRFTLMPHYVRKS
jgi:hypothetical protein